MGCFIGCFRTKGSPTVAPPEPVVARSKNALSSLFLDDEDSLRKREGGWNHVPDELDMKELKNEAKFLRASVTLLETPVETRKVLEKWEDISTQKGEAKSQFNPWLPDTSIEELKQQKQSSELPTPIKVCEEWTNGAGSIQDNTPSSCMTDGNNERKFSISSVEDCHIQNVTTGKDVHDGKDNRSVTSSDSPVNFSPTVQCKNKSVHYCKSDRSAFLSKSSSSESANQYSKQSGSASSSSRSKPSPYPTPLKLPEPLERNESEDAVSDSVHLGEPLKSDTEEILALPPPSGKERKELSAGKETENEASLSAWSKQHSPRKEGKNERFDAISDGTIYYGGIPRDRPILGMVATHWNEEISHISPKWWDGNGIPNSTNKYKEDQKVSWHATPFEERLEKALSEETLVSLRKSIRGSPPVEFNDPDESDTGFSHMRSTTTFKSVVSC